MRFALLGNHPDGLDMAYALVATGRHQIVAVTSPSLNAGPFARLGENARRVDDLEEVLADPSVEAVIVASGPAHRDVHLRRALQSERDVLCVYPPDPAPDLAYEAAMLQNDSGRVLLPLLHEALHPGLLRLIELRTSREIRLGATVLIDLQHQGSGAILQLAGTREDKPSIPGWHVLRTLGGEIAEVAAFAFAEEANVDAALLTSGRFENGGLFRALFLPNQAQPLWRLVVVGEEGRAELEFPLGQPGPAFLTWNDTIGRTHEEAWDLCDPWPSLMKIFEQALANPAEAMQSGKGPRPGGVTWQDAVRGLELDDAARRSIERRRASSMEYQEASEEVGFKGTMTLVGCGLIWVVLLLFIVSIWVPPLRWGIVPVLVLFLGLQLFRWIIPRGRDQNEAQSKEAASRER
ncbi:MAG TPA: Gfo/Idh/MocA family oxidoreductase [Gemmataceae bacterium]|jgi:predicted dehydrogenase